jgi:hypothetical protein
MHADTDRQKGRQTGRQAQTGCCPCSTDTPCFRIDICTGLNHTAVRVMSAVSLDRQTRPFRECIYMCRDRRTDRLKKPAMSVSHETSLGTCMYAYISTDWHRYTHACVHTYVLTRTCTHMRGYIHTYLLVHVRTERGTNQLFSGSHDRTIKIWNCECPYSACFLTHYWHFRVFLVHDVQQHQIMCTSTHVLCMNVCICVWLYAGRCIYNTCAYIQTHEDS